jgi:D-amino-acid dehydrogenase
VPRGFLDVYETEKAFESARAAHHDGIEVLDGVAARDACPQLATAPAGAFLFPDDAHSDPAQLVATLAAGAVEAGVTLRMGIEAYGIDRRPGANMLRTSVGNIGAGEVVIAAGAWSPKLAAGLPLRLPVQGGKGYHVDLEPGDSDPAMPVRFIERRIVVTPLGRRLRLTGVLQLAGTDLSVDQRRVDTILAGGRQLLTGLADRPVTSVWRGLRPCSPDGLPIIGRIPDAENIIVATGHGMWGLQLAPVTARLVADVVTNGQRDDDALDALAPGRFRALPLIRDRPAR